MAGFFAYDLGFLIVFCAFVAWFLYSRKRGLQREGIMFLYKTKFGMKFINYVGTKYKKVLNVLKYPILVTGFGLMLMMVFLLGQTIYTYLAVPEITQIIKAPPIMPLIPYFPQIFGVQSFFPPFYFTYFILALIVVAFVHEFAHGIYMKLYNIKIKSTGVAFLGPILGAFVEQDDKDMQSKPGGQQMTILGAGVFANIVFALIFFLLLVGFFSVAFVPAGYVFSSYSISPIAVNQISSFGENVEKLSVLNSKSGLDNFTKVSIEDSERDFFISTQVKEKIIKNELLETDTLVYAFEDAPAFNAGLEGVIREIDGVQIKDQKDLQSFLESKKPGESIKIITRITERGIGEYEVVLQEHPFRQGVAYLGVASVAQNSKGILRKVILLFINFKSPSTYYETVWDGNLFILFIIYFGGLR